MSGATPPSSSQFAWLHPGSVPAGWQLASIPIGAAMPYPRGWERLKGDAGTATAGLLDGNHHFIGYLNLTPRQSSETTANWGRFRLAHNAEENDRNIKIRWVTTTPLCRGPTWHMPPPAPPPPAPARAVSRQPAAPQTISDCGLSGSTLTVTLPPSATP